MTAGRSLLDPGVGWCTSCGRWRHVNRMTPFTDRVRVPHPVDLCRVCADAYTASGWWLELDHAAPMGWQ